MSEAPEVKSVDLFEFLRKRAIERIEAAPIVVTVHLSDGSVEMPIGPKHRWFKELNRRRTEQLSALRAKLSMNPNLKKESAATVSTQTADPVKKNEYYTSRATK